MKLKLLQQAIDEGLASGVSDRSIDELIAEAESSEKGQRRPKNSRPACASRRRTTCRIWRISGKVCSTASSV
jgi:hypothetical protein